MEEIKCDAHNRMVPIEGARIVSFGENRQNFVVGAEALKEIERLQVWRRRGVPCSPREEYGLDFYLVSFERGVPQKGALDFSVDGDHPLLFPHIQAALHGLSVR